MPIHLWNVLPRVNNPVLVLSLFARLLFEIYWTVAARASSPAKFSESRKSWQVHVFLVNAGFMLLYAPMRG
jgi:hypothetical protein